MFLILLFVFTQSVEFITDCSGQCLLTEYGCRPPHNSVYCTLPKYRSGCPYGCVNDEYGCINDMISKPVTSLVKPDKCCNNSFCFFDPFCNDDGHGDFCPQGCTHINGSCSPQYPNHYCDRTWLCPYSCTYDNSSYECVSNDHICGLTNQTCPANCSYNPYTNSCFSTDPHVVCDKLGMFVCPDFCTRNLQTLSCDGNICSPQINPLCPENCYYDGSLCRPNSLNDICEPLIYKKCSHDYVIKGNFPNCTVDNVINACIDENGYLRYPKRLDEVYSNTMCVRAFDILCNKMQFGIITICPQGCGIDILHNKCARNNNTICGDYGIVCPKNWRKSASWQYNLPKCYNDNNVEPLCDIDYTLKMIRFQNGNNMSACFPDFIY